MQKIHLKKIFIISTLASMFLLSGCNDAAAEKAVKIEEKKTSEVKINETPTSVEKKEPQVLYTKYDSVVNEIFQDIAKIGPNGKYMIMIFGTNVDPYTDRLKADIKNSEELTNKVKNNFSSYYLKAHENLRHKLYHEGEYMDVDTKTMISIYGIQSTPTIIFNDKEGKAILVVPGYMPTKQFIETIKFIESKKWENKDRKNGEIYEALKNHYIENGIDVKVKEKDK